jgi:hypothetical protein
MDSSAVEPGASSMNTPQGRVLEKVAARLRLQQNIQLGGEGKEH